MPPRSRSRTPTYISYSYTRNTLKTCLQPPKTLLLHWGNTKKCLLGKYSMFYKIVISLNMWFKRHGLCKTMKNKKICTHEGPRRKRKKQGHVKVPRYRKKDKHMKAHKKKKKMIAMSQNKKLERDHIYKRSIVQIQNCFIHTLTLLDLRV